jgi:hypothetical protein
VAAVVEVGLAINSQAVVVLHAVVVVVALRHKDGERGL